MKLCDQMSPAALLASITLRAYSALNSCSLVCTGSLVAISECVDDSSMSEVERIGMAILLTRLSLSVRDAILGSVVLMLCL